MGSRPVRSGAPFQDRDGAFWFSTGERLTRYRPDHRLLPKPPRLTILAEREYTEHDGVARITAGRKALFRLSVVDLKDAGPRPAVSAGSLRRGARPSMAPGHRPGWLPGTSETQFDWQTNRAGTYTFAAQYIDRDLNYSPPTVLDGEGHAVCGMRTRGSRSGKAVALSVWWVGICGALAFTRAAPRGRALREQLARRRTQSP